MTGPFINSCAIIFGTLIGILLKKIIPKHVEEGLTPTFALIALGIGISMIVKVKTFPVVVLSIILGNILGDLLHLEKHIQAGAVYLQKRVNSVIPHANALPEEEFSLHFSSLIVLFSFSSLGILGALTEGLTGDVQLLIIKSILDFFTAIIFALSLGIAVSFIAIPQLAIQSALFFLAVAIMPVMDELAYADFSATGGIIMLALGLRMARIRHFAVINMIPALFLVLPFSFLWRAIFT